MSKLTFDPASWRDHGMAFGVAFALHAGLVYVLFNLSHTPVLQPVPAAVIHTQLVHVPAPVAVPEPPAPEPVVEKPALPTPKAQMPVVDEAALALKRVQQQKRDLQQKRDQQQRQEQEQARKQREEAERRERQLAQQEQARQQQAREAAAQALITGAFSLTRQAIQLGYVPLGSGRYRHLHHTVALVGEQFVGSLDVVEPKTVGDQRGNVYTAAGDHRHQPAHAFFAAGAPCGHVGGKRRLHA